ncbi:mechanosensitive ion channel [Empedobacter stercoris]|uniref:Mechanosensitive ion channel n=1 Tax=Empedobacter stercoris TaxID=1628248 RepID=A0ABX1WN27_9FLAO|nr:mechanosensitive ion channel domain-containing protein [Empedobacter stercoris]MCA4782573.1 mechanosensitive ion channel [Empedobacter stercoris]MCA4810196.1 mechanosensitive ion channel [Empedobacter stercoris]NOJ76059.1 mechanosensitive ion channel [Empedobacter stercoris]QNT14989.1 mechanosensitive ion channel [Empedobacter stercoris]
MQDKSFYEEISDGVKYFFNQYFKIDLSENLFTFLEVVIWIAILFILDFILRAIILPILRKIKNFTENDWMIFLYRNKVFISLIHLIPISFAMSMNQILFKDDGNIFVIIQRITELISLIVFTQLIFRVINATIDVYNVENSYTTVGVRTFGQMMKFMITFFSIISGIMILFTVDKNTIITVLGALTAAVLLIFRDAIFGFVSGLQISYSKIVKVGDWITISKGDIEGIVKEININLVKIEKFDKSIATVPTVDLVSSQVTNHMPMMATGTRQIKRSISFNVNSFQFCNEDMLNRFEDIALIHQYIQQKRHEISIYNQNIENSDLDINGKNLTNIGVFRIYVDCYLKSLKTVSQKDPIIVKQLPVSPLGMPLEIGCFTTSANNLEFERIQSDIFDHLLTACRKFDLEIMQSFSLSDFKKL